MEGGGEPSRTIRHPLTNYRAVTDITAMFVRVVTNTCLALDDEDHPAREVIRRYMDALRHRLSDKLRAAGPNEPNDVAEQPLVFVDGALVAGALRPHRHPARGAGALAQRLLA